MNAKEIMNKWVGEMRMNKQIKDEWMNEYFKDNIGFVF